MPATHPCPAVRAKPNSSHYRTPTTLGASAGDGQRADGVADGASERALLDRLSSRQRQVLAGLAAGDQDKVIARRLGLSFWTVKEHVKAILRRLAVPDRRAAAAMARRAGGEE